MTTFTTRAIYDRSTYNPVTDESTTLEARSVDVKIILPDGVTTIPYTVDGFDQDEFDVTFNFPAGAQLILDGVAVDPSDYNANLASIIFDGQNVTLLSIGYYDFQTSTDYYYTMSVAGPALPNITSVAQYNGLEARVSGFLTTLNPDPGPGNSVRIDTIPGVTASQNDTFFAVGANDGSFGAFGEDVFVGGLGNDTINMGDDNVEYVELDYSNLTGGITANINGVANTGTITKTGIGTDTLIDVANPMQEGWFEGGLNLIGGRGNDNITLRTVSQSFSEISNSAGSDTITLLGAADSNVRLNYRYGGEGGGATTGIVANLATGVIQDGKGGTDTINRSGFSGLLELRGTDFNDSIMGSAGNDRFILERGNDTLDGGAGHDTLRYDRNGLSNLVINTATGTATGNWNGQSFNHIFSNIEEFRGGRAGSFTDFFGSAGNDILRAGGGNTEFRGGLGNDTFRGGAGNDTAIHVESIGDVGISVDAVTRAITITSDSGVDNYDAAVDGFEFDGVYYNRFEIEGRDGQERGQTYIAQNKTDFSEGYNATNGSNTIDMTAITTGSIFLNYAAITQGTSFVLNGVTNTGSIEKGVGGALGTDTLINVAGPMNSADTGGLDLRGTNFDDYIDIVSRAGSFINLFGAAGEDSFNLSGAGRFRLSYGWEQGSSGVNVDLTLGVAFNDGFGDADIINFTGTGTLQLEGSRLADTLRGSSRDDVFIGRGGNDTINGEGGTDLLRFDRSGVESVTVDLGAGTASGIWDGVAFTNTLSNIENIRGSRAGNDNITGSTAANELRAYLGDDTLDGGGGNDTLYGGLGDDDLRGGAGIDTAVFNMASTDIDVVVGTFDFTVLSTDGFDLIASDIEFLQFTDRTISFADAAALAGQNPSQIGFAGYDHLQSGAASELLFSRDGNDWITPGAGNDTVNGGNGMDMLNLGTYAQAVIVDLAAGTVRSGPDVKQISNIENVTGSIYSDFFTGDDGANWFRGLGGYDWFIASDGADTYDGSNGRDMVTYIYADAGVTVDLGQQRGLAGQAAEHTYVQIERATGSIFDDIFYGSDGADEFRGAGGYDLFIDSAGRDRYDGGTGLDTVSYALSASAVNASLLRGSGGPNYDLYTSIEILVGSNRNDTLTGDHGRNVLRGGHGNDTLQGLGGNDYLEGGTGNDVLDGGIGYDVAQYRNAASQYTVTTVGNVTTVSHAIDGIDTLTNIEALRFSDGFDYL